MLAEPETKGILSAEHLRGLFFIIERREPQQHLLYKTLENSSARGSLTCAGILKGLSCPVRRVREPEGDNLISEKGLFKYLHKAV